ncbi:hypothetical protein [Amycolatopsis dendrobii]|uniref:Uncharacterized protein n=1 Tax=Amycolatopsis dendrobii TaxID=2760662 RepID=A0A7W3VWF5_9PSEU|nr:hypothetical protein [Amycolatopsis dendrobii]MBB1153967.1 hypothetical protein [Amycolatopsis dendrobii]
MITSLDMLQHVVEHAKRWRLSDERFKQLDITAAQASITLPDHAVALFVEWAHHLDGVLITASAGYPRTSGLLHAVGKLLSGHVVHVYVTSDGERMRNATLLGSVLLAEVEQYHRHNLTPVGAE